MIREEIYQEIMGLHEQGLGSTRIHKQFYHLGLLGGTPEVIRFLKLIQPSIPRKNVGDTIA